MEPTSKVSSTISSIQSFIDHCSCTFPHPFLSPIHIHSQLQACHPNMLHRKYHRFRDHSRSVTRAHAYDSPVLSPLAILVLRVWYLFSNNRTIRIGVVLAFVLSYIISLSFAIRAAMQVRLLPIPTDVPVAVGCQAARPPQFWRMFFPSLILHVSPHRSSQAETDVLVYRRCSTS